MKRIYEWTTRRRYLLMALFLAAAILCGWCRQFIAVNYDMNDYLPVDSSSTVSLEKISDHQLGSVGRNGGLCHPACGTV